MTTNIDLETIWQNVLGELEVSLSKANFTTWLNNTFIHHIQKDKVIIGVPTGFAKEWLNKKCSDEILKSIQKQITKINKIDFKVTTSQPTEQSKLFAQPNDTVTLDQKKSKKISKDKAKKFKSKYSFENFVVGSSNKLAHAASLAVAEKPGKRYNPLFIWGGVGLGKTHLMHAVGNAMIKKNQNKKILYVSSETFMNDYINAVQKGEGRAKDFKNYYRNIDALLIDDIQFIAGKIGTQEEFFHTFNWLHQKNKQIVISSDRPPKAIDMEDRLRSRCEWGMIVDISQPDFETRKAILKSKAEQINFNCPDDVLSYIAENVQENIRELEGALNRLMAYLELNNEKPSKETAIMALSGMVSPKNQSLSWKKISDSVCKFYNISHEDILSAKRSKEIVVPRQILMYLIRQEMSFSYPQIANLIGKKDHTTIMHGVEKIEKEIRNNPDLQKQILNIKKSFYD
jgi:chromosomal replication initiator protein